MRAYHFLQDDMRSWCGDEPPWKVGEEREHKGDLVMCESGYHASPSWRDALRYAPGAMACIVKLSGDIIKDNNKSVAQKRKLVDARDATRVLRTFTCDCAERALKRDKVTDKRSWEAIRVSRLYNGGQATIEELRAARSAARVTAEDAVRDAEVAWQKRQLNKLMKALFKEGK